MIIKIDTMAFGGYGVGRIDGKACFVDYAVPGDELSIEIYEDKDRFCFASIKEIITPSKLRIEPICPNFTICGGCTHLNIDYKTELSFKADIVKDQLNRITKMDDSEIPEIDLVTSDRFNYRSHSTVKSANSKIGFFKKRSNELVSFPESSCILLSQQIQKFIKKYPESDNSDEIKISENMDGTVYSSHDKLNKKIVIKEEENGISYERGIWDFFQGNKKLRSKMLERVYEYSELDKSKEFLDIGSGCGFFSLFLSDKSLRGTGCDISRDAIKWAKHNASINSISNIKFFAMPFEEFRPSKKSPSCMIIDPPRSGLHKRSRKTVNYMKPENIVYVSCNPSTFARDLKDFIKNGYKLEKLTLIDMFPCTHHIELIAKISR